MFDYQLFLGFSLTSSYQNDLALLPSSLRSLFITEDNVEYLQEVEYKGQIYLGKNLGVLVKLSSLELAKVHIYSVLKRLVPHYSYEDHSLVFLVLSSLTSVNN